MAMTDQEQNIVSELMDWAANQLKLQEQSERLLARYNLNDFFNQVTDEELDEIGAFKHLTASEIANAINSLKAILITLGASNGGEPVRDDVSGHAANLIKLRG